MQVMQNHTHRDQTYAAFLRWNHFWTLQFRQFVLAVLHFAWLIAFDSGQKMKKCSLLNLYNHLHKKGIIKTLTNSAIKYWPKEVVFCGDYFAVKWLNYTANVSYLFGGVMKKFPNLLQLSSYSKMNLMSFVSVDFVPMTKVACK